MDQHKYFFKRMKAEQHLDAYAIQIAAKQAQDSLLRRIGALAALIPADTADTHGVWGLLEGVKEDLAVQGDATDWLLNYIPREFRRPPAAAALAQKVFGTPELLERILTFVDTRTAFHANRVSKDFSNTIQGSSSLQRKIGLKPNPDANLSSKAQVHIVGSGIDWNWRFEPHVDTNWGPVSKVEVTVTAREADVRIPGSRLSRVLITQPPVKQFDVSVSCCSEDSRGFKKPVISLQNEAGLTVGELRDKIVEVRNAHRMCPHALLGDHNDDGTVEPKITFSGDLLLRDDDASVLHTLQKFEENQRRDDEFDDFDERMSPYIRAKQAGKFNLSFACASMSFGVADTGISLRQLPSNPHACGIRGGEGEEGGREEG